MATISLTQISNGDSLDATVVDNNFDTIANEINGNLDNDNIDANAAIALTKLASTAWTAFTPTWTNLTVGNATQDSAYFKIGRLVVFRISLQWGSSTSASGSVSVSLPVTARNYQGTNSNDFTPLAWGEAKDASGGAYTLSARFSSTTTIAINAHNAASTYVTYDQVSGTIPMTWTTSDCLTLQGIYEAAS